MAKLEGPLYGDWATGNLGDGLAFKKGIPFTSPGDEGEIPYSRIEKRRAPSRSRSPGQAGQRDLFQTARTAWLALEDSDKLRYKLGAPAGWSGFNYFLFIALKEAGETLGALVLGRDILNQGNLQTGIPFTEYVFSFSSALDEIPTYEDGTQPGKAWMYNRLAQSVLSIEEYLIMFKETIEGG